LKTACGISDSKWPLTPVGKNRRARAKRHIVRIAAVVGDEQVIDVLHRGDRPGNRFAARDIRGLRTGRERQRKNAGEGRYGISGDRAEDLGYHFSHGRDRVRLDTLAPERRLCALLLDGVRDSTALRVA
jgi:hypothetical protein